MSSLGMRARANLLMPDPLAKVVFEPSGLPIGKPIGVSYAMGWFVRNDPILAYGIFDGRTRELLAKSLRRCKSGTGRARPIHIALYGSGKQCWHDAYVCFPRKRVAVRREQRLTSWNRFEGGGYRDATSWLEFYLWLRYTGHWAYPAPPEPSSESTSRSNYTATATPGTRYRYLLFHPVAWCQSARRPPPR